MLTKKSILRIFSIVPLVVFLLASVGPAYAVSASPAESRKTAPPSFLQFAGNGNSLGFMSNNMLAVPNEVVATGITNIQDFLTKCPQNDPAYNQIRQDFELRANGVLISYPIPCTEPITAIPIAQYTDELIALQTLRIAYYMGMGTAGKLPWTSKDLYSWMKGNVSGINLKTTPGLYYCCDVINGKKYISFSRKDDLYRDFTRDWTGFAGYLSLYAHETRHADPNDPGHTTGCPPFPLPTDTKGCDAAYDLNNLGGYGVDHWLNANFASGYLNIGIGCAPPDTARDYALSNASNADSTRERFVTNVPPIVTVPLPYGGICTTFADVSASYWAVAYTERLYQAGITGGCALIPLQYCPEGTVTRAQMAVFLERGIHGSSYNPPAIGGSTGFGDVSTSYWAAAWIKQLAAEGITGGCGSGIYCPEAPVTRAQMAIFLLRSKHGASYSPPAVGGSTGFGDVPTDYWAGAWIKQLVAEGITAGCGTGTYCPESPVTRAQMAVFLVRTFNLP